MGCEEGHILCVGQGGCVGLVVDLFQDSSAMPALQLLTALALPAVAVASSGDHPKNQVHFQ